MSAISKYLASSLVVVVLGSAYGLEYELKRYTVDGGSVIAAMGGDFNVSATVGQPDAGRMAGGEFALTGGFWFEINRGDCNADGGVGVPDMSTLPLCLAGPGSQYADSECACLDFDADGDVDLLDFAHLQVNWYGE